MIYEPKPDQQGFVKNREENRSAKAMQRSLRVDSN